MTRLLGCGLLLGCLGWAGAALSAEVGLVTGLTGSVNVQPGTEQSSQALQSYVKLQEGDRLTLAANTRLQLVLFASGQEEVWQGPAVLQLSSAGSQVLQSSQPAQVRTLPRIVVKQLAKTPAPDGQVKAGMVRLRSMPSGGTVESVEQHYAELRAEASPQDTNPELYLLASYLELQEYDKLETLLQQMDQGGTANSEVKLLTALYGRAVNSARNASQP